jgi:RNA polymerase-interacting CarD/CdnL/TRCF family regulator
LARTKRELNELQSKLDSGGYDQPELDRVINGLERMVNDSNLSGRDRDMLNDDLNRMREFRARRGRG